MALQSRLRNQGLQEEVEEEGMVNMEPNLYHKASSTDLEIQSTK